jgi:polysaccharide export outer membrane protein
MRQEAEASHELYLRVLEKVEEAGLLAGTHGSDISVVDPARQPVKPVSPNLPLYLAITFFAGLWLATGGVLMAESLDEKNFVQQSRGDSLAILLFLATLAVGAAAHAQLPSPATTGLPPGVTPIPQNSTPQSGARSVPNAKDAPAVWDGATANVAGMPSAGATAGSLGAPMPAPIAPGDLIDISEYHTPEFHTATRVAAAGTVTLPMINEVQVGGMDEKAAAHAIESALAAKGMLLHPLVFVMVTAYAGQDVSVLGEVTHPGVYPFTYHHRLLDLISAASGLSPNAGRLVNVFHANDSKTAHPIVLDPSGTDTAADHNPELSPGDTVQVSRAGLVYVVGDVIRPGGFAVDPTQGLTVVQALTLAWGPSQNAATGNAVLIREQKGGRTLTRLNLNRMLHGQDPDQPILDRDILYIPDSEAKYLWNRTLEAAIQSTLGVTIYSALVYSSRY